MRAGAIVPVLLFTLLVGVLRGATGADHPEGAAPPEAMREGAPLFDNLGDYHHPVTTSVSLAQRYFDQGLTLVYAFNHREAIRSFTEAARLDPNLAMAHWGIALAYGPNINQPMPPEAVPAAWEALQRARELAPRASRREQDYIAALSRRYVPEPVEDRSALDLAYAEAMREVAGRYPDDVDAATLFAEALMNTMPWDYWTADLQPRPATVEVMATLESVLARRPDHPGATHYYIHAVEAGPQPEKALRAADTLRDLVPGAGHLVHMPSHIYLRLGLYHDASRSNERAIEADEAYIAQCNAQGYYPLLYHPHNYNFLWYTTSMEGRSEASLAAARQVAAQVTEEHVEVSRLRPLPLFALARFGRWEEILAEPRPEPDDVFTVAIWHYTRGLAHAAQGQQEAAAREAAQLDRLAASEAAQELEQPFFYGFTQIRIAQAVLNGEIAGLRGENDRMIRDLERAVALEDGLPYMEPPYWYFPVRHSLGAALLRIERPAEAEAVYREDLRRHPANGWALFGLVQSLRNQGRNDAADEVQRQFEHAWLRADVTLRDSRSP